MDIPDRPGAEFLSERAANLTPYTAGEQPKGKGFIKLNTNENPYPPTSAVKQAVTEGAGDLRLYPDPDSRDLCAAIAEANGTDPECVFCGNGSDEVLSFVFYAFFDGALPVLFPDITYSFYPVYAKFYDIKYETVPLNRRFEIEIKDYLKPASGVIFPNPNAPTSVFLDTGKIRRLLEYHARAGKVVAVDEAYIAFGGESMTAYLKDYQNLLIIRTFSKSHALAGLRTGYALGCPALTGALRRVKDSFNSYPVDRIAAAAARAAVLDYEYYSDTASKIIRTRDRFAERIRGIGFYAPPSSANFVFISHESLKACGLRDALRENGVLVRHFDKPRIDNFLRVTIGTDDEMDYVYEILRRIVKR